jgi:hypothetical protein
LETIAPFYKAANDVATIEPLLFSAMNS